MVVRFPSLLALLTWSAFAANTPTFHQDVEPILSAKCAPCHYAGGSAPFPLISYADALKHARQMEAVTQSRYMPPWLPSAQPLHFSGELRLTDRQLQTISDWVRAGSPEGPSALTFSEYAPAGAWPLGTPDLIVKASNPYQVPATGRDIFWNFVLTPQLMKGRFVRAIDIRPSNPSIVHHANVIIDRTGSSRQREKTPGFGFPGMDVTVLRSPLDLDGHFLFWKPGSIPWSEPDGLAWRLNPGNDLILNMHLQPSGKPELEQPAIALYFTDKPSTHYPYLLQLEHDGALDIPAGRSDFVVTDSVKLPLDTQVVAIYPHAHYLATLLEAWAVEPDGTRVQLIRIPSWNQNWQAVYRYQEPVFLPVGTTVSMRYHYDNSSANPRNPHHPPKRVEAGNQTTDEMGHLWLEVLPQAGHDSRRIYAEAWARHQLEKYPNSFSANLTLGSLALARLHAQDAVEPLRKAVRLQPEDAIARNLFGESLDATGRMQEALTQFQLVVKQKPDFDNARFNLAHVLAHTGGKAAAIENLKIILAAHPNDPAARAYLDELTGGSTF